MSTEQIACGIPDMLILMEETVKTAEKKLFSKTSNAFVLGVPFPGEIPLTSWDLQMHVVHLHDAFSPLPPPQKKKNLSGHAFLNLFHFSSFLLHLKIVLSFLPPCDQ